MRIPVFPGNPRRNMSPWVFDPFFCHLKIITNKKKTYKFLQKYDRQAHPCTLWDEFSWLFFDLYSVPSLRRTFWDWMRRRNSTVKYCWVDRRRPLIYSFLRSYKVIKRILNTCKYCCGKERPTHCQSLLPENSYKDKGKKERAEKNRTEFSNDDDELTSFQSELQSRSVTSVGARDLGLRGSHAQPFLMFIVHLF